MNGSADWHINREGDAAQGICVTTFTLWNGAKHAKQRISGLCPDDRMFLQFTQEEKCAGFGMEGHRTMRYHLYGKNRRIFLEGLRRYRDRGVIIRIDGKEAEESEWVKLLEVQRDGSFYMGDYIVEEHVSSEADATEEKQGSVAMVCEPAASYEAASQPTDSGIAGESAGEATDQNEQTVRTLKEIRFDRVYHR